MPRRNINAGGRPPHHKSHRQHARVVELWHRQEGRALELLAEVAQVGRRDGERAPHAGRRGAIAEAT